MGACQSHQTPPLYPVKQYSFQKDDPRHQLLLGYYYLSQNKIPRALFYLETVFKKQPSRSVGFQLAKIYLTLRYEKKTLDMIDTLVVLYPKDLETLLFAGEVYLTFQNWHQLDKHLAFSLKHFPKNEAFTLLHIKSLMVRKQFQQARVALHNSLRENPQSEILMWLKVDLDFQAGEYVKSLESVQALIELNPQSLRAWVFKGLLEIKLKQFKLAADSFQQALSLKPDLENIREIYLELILAQTDTKRVLKSLLQFKQDFQGSLFAELLSNVLIFIFSKQNDHIGAIKLYEEDVPKLSLETGLVLSFSYAYEGHFEKANRILKKLEDMYPNGLPFILLHETMLYILKMDLESAQKLLNEIPDSFLLQSFPFDALYLKVLEYISPEKSQKYAQKMMNTYQSSESAFLYALSGQMHAFPLKEPYRVEEFLKSYPEHVGAMNLLAYYYAHTNDRHLWQKGYELIQKALEYKPDDPDFIDTQAVLWIQMGRCQEAWDCLNREEVDDSNPVVQFHKGWALQACQKFDDALKIYKTLNDFFKKKNRRQIEFNPEWGYIMSEISRRIDQLHIQLIQGE